MEVFDSVVAAGAVEELEEEWRCGLAIYLGRRGIHS